MSRPWALLAGALPVLAFPRPGLDWLAWVALVPGLLLILRAATARQAAVLGWWFGAGYLLAALYWTLPNIGPGVLLVAVVFGAPWAGWGLAAWRLLPAHPAAALAVLPSIWVVIELIRSWPALGGPWALLGASQWRHPAVLSLAALGGVWLISFALVAVNAAVALAVLSPAVRLRMLATAVLIALTGPVAYAVRSEPPVERARTVALVQPGVVHATAARFAAAERLTAGLPPGVDLVVWGESSVGYDLDRRPDLVARLRSQATGRDLLVNVDARDASGRISKSSVVVTGEGLQGRYVKTRLVPFGEYIPLRPVLGWLARISNAAGEDRVPGTGARAMPAGGMPVGPLVCFESAFPDLGRAVVRRGAQVIVYQSSTSTFQRSWAPQQHAALGAVRAAETGRPVVQAAHSGVSAAFDARGRRLAWLDTDRRGAATVPLDVPPARSRTLYDRLGDYVAYISLLITIAAATRPRRQSIQDRDPATGGVTGGDDAQ